MSYFGRARVVPRLSARFAGAAPFVRPIAKPIIKRETMLQNSKPDLVFLINGQKIYAHTHVLSRNSRVFDRMCKGPFSNEKVIEIKDSSKEMFELVIKGMYEGVDVFITEGIQECLDCFMIVHKYNIKQLEVDLLKLILKKTTETNAFEVLESPGVKLGLLPSVKSKCWSVIEQNTLKAIESQGFLFLSWNTLFELLNNDRITISEFKLGKRCWDWAMNNKKDKSCTEVLGTAIYQLRFPIMTYSEFKLLSNLGMLREGEKNELKQNFRNNLTFLNVKRSNRCQCQKEKLSCQLCSTKKQFWISKQPLLQPPRFSISEDFANNKDNNNRGQREICTCQKYVSCPQFPNGATFRIMKAKRLI